MVQEPSIEGYATIRRSKGRSEHKTLLRSSTSSDESNQQQFEMIEMSSRRKSSNGKFESDVAYAKRNVVFDESSELDEGVLNDIESDADALSACSDNVKIRTFKTFKPRNSIESGDDGSDKDLQQSSECFQSLPYDIIMSPLKSPQYINQLNAMRSKTSSDGSKQFPLYSRPDSPKYGKLLYNRSTSPSADSMDNSSSNSSTYSTSNLHHQQHITAVFKQTAMSQSLHIPHPHNCDENVILINVQSDGSNKQSKQPLKINSGLNYRKSFSHVQSNAVRWQNDCENDSLEHINKAPLNAMTMTKSLYNPTTSISHICTPRRFATLAYPKEKQTQQQHETSSNKSSSSLNDNTFRWDPILSCKIGSQSTLRTKPPVPWWELAIKKEFRQSCPPLSPQAHVVNAFEQSLQNMTNRLQQLTATTEKKESEITEMRQTIELLRKQSIQAGLTQAHMQSMGVQVNVNGSSTKVLNGSPTKTNGQHEQQQQQSQTLNGNMQRQHSTDSMCSVNSNGSNGSSSQEKKKKKGWLRSSFTKAFSRNAKITKTNRQTNHSDSKSSLPPTPQRNASSSVHDSSAITGKSSSPSKSPHRYIPVVENAKPVDSIEVDCHPIVEDLKKQLREKDMVLTDIRLEALTQASQMETLKETVRTMRQEMMNLKQNNERLQRMVSTRSLAGSEASLHGCPASPSGSMGDSRRYSLATDSGMSRPPLELPQNLDETEEEPPAPAPEPIPAPLSPTIIADLSPTIERISISNEILCTPAEDVADPVDGKKIGIAVFLGQPEAFAKYADEMIEEEQNFNSNPKPRQNGFDLLHSQETIIAYTYISGKTTWQNLDYIVRKTFKDYLSRIDPGTNLGLNTDSITSYHLGEAKRGPEMGFPELLPCGYIIGHVKTLYICLQGVGSLAFDSLIPRSIVHRYINLLTEHRRLILCGPKGTGKSYLARKLAEFLVAKSNRSPAESIATFNVDNKSSNLQQYLGTIAEQATINGAAEELPLVIILDNLHHASALGDVFSCLLSAGPAARLPCIIGTMSQATCNTTNLQLHHNFRWVLTANHMEPVKGFLGRYLRRRLFHHDLLTSTQQTQMEKVFKWLPSVWLHVNTFLENHSSSDVTIGPQLFLQCPLSEEESQKWFVDLWNHQLAPYLVDAIKEGVQLYGRRGNSWTDPCLYVRETYPWKITPTTVPTLRQITADDVGLEAGVTGNMDSDPLLNMLHMLQQAAASENVDHDNSDCASLDSNFTHESAGTEQ